jgi:hypothetical protein
MNFLDLMEELYLIDSHLYTLDQLLEEQLKYLSQIGLSTSNNDLLKLYNQHKVRRYIQFIPSETIWRLSRRQIIKF